MFPSSLQQGCSPRGRTRFFASIFAAARSALGGCTRCALAHATRDPAVWQQQLRQHCSASRHPHLLNMHGNGRLRSLAKGTGIGTPLTANTNSPNDSHPQTGKPTRKIVRRVRRGRMAGRAGSEVLPEYRSTRVAPQQATGKCPYSVLGTQYSVLSTHIPVANSSRMNRAARSHCLAAASKSTAMALTVCGVSTLAAACV